jgi:DNA polymerase-3 subunit gamma/tau
MENYIVSARKYRPTTFESVVAQKSLTTTLKNAIQSGRLAHAYLFCGPRGVGKTTCARIFAKTINCTNPTENGEPCNQCESCQSFNQQRSYSIYELDAASNNSVDDIRSLNEQVRIPPQIGKYKVYIIDEVHMLTQAAFNAFLKTLEEPPSYAIFILATTEKNKILPTILSRCQVYDFNRISVNDTVNHLKSIAEKEGITAEEDALNVIAVKSDGGMRDALSTFDQVVSFCGKNITYKNVVENLNILDYDYYFKLTQTCFEMQIPSALVLVNEILSKGFDAGNIISGLLEHARDLLVCKNPETAMLLNVGAGIREKYLKQAEIIPQDFLLDTLELCNQAELEYKQSKNKRLLLELLIIRMCQLMDVKKKVNS